MANRLTACITFRRCSNLSVNLLIKIATIPRRPADHRATFVNGFAGSGQCASSSRLQAAVRMFSGRVTTVASMPEVSSYVLSRLDHRDKHHHYCTQEPLGNRHVPHALSSRSASTGPSPAYLWLISSISRLCANLFNQQAFGISQSAGASWLREFLMTAWIRDGPRSPSCPRPLRSGSSQGSCQPPEVGHIYRIGVARLLRLRKAFSIVCWLCSRIS